MEYGFNTELAKKIGLNESIMIRHFQYWIDKNKANKKNCYDGKYWTYNSIAAFCDIFPFWTKDQIRYTLKKLTDKNILITGNFNKNPYDKTLWYSLNDDVIAKLLQSDSENLPNANSKSASSNCENSIVDVGNLPNRIVNFHEPIPLVNTNVKPFEKTHTHDSACEKFSIIDAVNEFCKDYKAVKGCEDLTNKEREEVAKVLEKEKGYNKDFWCTVFQKSLGGWEINENGKVRTVPCGLGTILESYGGIYRNEKGLKRVSLPKNKEAVFNMPFEPDIVEDEDVLKETILRCKNSIIENYRKSISSG